MTQDRTFLPLVEQKDIGLHSRIFWSLTFLSIKIPKSKHGSKKKKHRPSTEKKMKP